MEEQLAAQDTKTEQESVVFTTARFGEVSVPKSRIFTFPNGLVGLPESQRFTFVHQDEVDGPFFWMQSIDDPTLAFVVCEPQQFFPDYSVPLSKSDQTLLDIAEPEDGLVCVILVVPKDPRQISANLRGPLVINTQAQVGCQLVLAGEEYPVRANLFVDPREGGERCSS